MKKLFLYLIPILVLLMSCSKDDDAPTPVSKPPQGISTTAISQINGNSAVSGGNITTDGGAAITARGIIWSTVATPTIALTTKTSDGTGAGQFNSTMNGLAPGTLYYVRAYATNSVGTAYGDEKTFTTTAPPAEPNVYVAIQLQGSPNRALYWKNTSIVNLSDGARHAFAKSVFVNETGAYIAGEEHNASGVYVSKYWKDGQAINLSNGTKHAFASGIVVSGNNVYVSGSQETAGQRQAKYWVNGTEYNLTDGAKYAVANSIFVSGNDVYVVGNMNEPTERARYWKSGSEVLLSQTSGTVRSVANNICVNGSDVYVAGYQQFDAANGGKYIATVWKNGTPTLLGTSTNNSYATGVAVKNNNIYVAAYENEQGVNIARVWKNNIIMTNLSNGSIDAQTSSIFITAQEDVYVAGYSGNINSGIQAKYWKNGVSHTNNSGTYAWGIFVY
ncbi:MAG: hypothetical protein J0I32_04195 [Sphingobacteriales bacterium]|nr:hypothetical protein [Sphingobacteriales bacterium]OJW05200.1 MAG: hypothetical protein BGO52_22260 [Sphingobacteriales bacterium 44-61]